MRALRAFLPSIACREVIAAREGLKVARTGLRLRVAERLRFVGADAGFAVVIDEEEYFPRRDRGKGGWCNGFSDRPLSQGYHNVYIATTEVLAKRAQEAERSGDEMAFGLVLAVPPCCREFYDRHQDAAARVQNDFFPLGTAALVNRPPALLNLGAQYFDAALVSHFPCDLGCVPSLHLARANARLVAAYDRVWLSEMLALMNRATLYTEYSGVFLLALRDAHACHDVTYAPKRTLGTAHGRVERALSLGERVRLAGPDQAEILRDDTVVMRFSATHVRLFAPIATTIEEAIA